MISFTRVHYGPSLELADWNWDQWMQIACDADEIETNIPITEIRTVGAYE